MLKQIRVHGRGGQGVVTAAELIAIAAFFDGKEAQAFPVFGVERTGAPIESFVRISEKPIRTREQIQEPNILIVQDSTLLESVNVARGSNKDTIAIINSSKEKSELEIDLPQENIFVVDATKIAIKQIGKNIVNTVLLGAIAKKTKLFTIKSAEKAIKQKFAHKDKKIIETNIKAIREAYNTLSS